MVMGDMRKAVQGYIIKDLTHKSSWYFFIRRMGTLLRVLSADVTYTHLHLKHIILELQFSNFSLHQPHLDDLLNTYYDSVGLE